MNFCNEFLFGFFVLLLGVVTLNFCLIIYSASIAVNEQLADFLKFMMYFSYISIIFFYWCWLGNEVVEKVSGSFIYPLPKQWLFFTSHLAISLVGEDGRLGVFLQLVGRGFRVQGTLTTLYGQDPESCCISCKTLLQVLVGHICFGEFTEEIARDFLGQWFIREQVMAKAFQYFAVLKDLQ